MRYVTKRKFEDLNKNHAVQLAEYLEKAPTLENQEQYKYLGKLNKTMNKLAKSKKINADERVKQYNVQLQDYLTTAPIAEAPKIKQTEQINQIADILKIEDKKQGKTIAGVIEKLIKQSQESNKKELENIKKEMIDNVKKTRISSQNLALLESEKIKPTGSTRRESQLQKMSVDELEVEKKTIKGELEAIKQERKRLLVKMGDKEYTTAQVAQIKRLESSESYYQNQINLIKDILEEKLQTKQPGISHPKQIAARFKEIGLPSTLNTSVYDDPSELSDSILVTRPDLQISFGDQSLKNLRLEESQTGNGWIRNKNYF